MLSVVIETRNQEEALARTLASLVGGAVEGVVREVIVCGDATDEPTRAVAEHAGCHYLAGAQASAGVRQARSEWLLLLEPGARPLDGWMDSVLAHADDADGPARFRPAKQSRQPFFLRLLKGRRPLAEGLLITRTQALALSPADASADAIAKAVSARRLGAEIAVAPRD